MYNNHSIKNRETMYKRTEAIVKANMNITVNDLYALNLVSREYNFRNLATDIWGLTRRSYRPSYDISSCYNCFDPVRSVWFRTIIQAIGDVLSKRPCDLGAWSCDFPPFGIETCTSEVHICAPAALGFLLSLGSEGEDLGGLSPGTIRNILGKDLIKELETQF